ncbi:YhgE/Pip domain-containing protein [Streptacidiphilus sp. PAMC 29251]
MLSGLLALLLTLPYLGGTINPQGDLHHLPLGIVNADQSPPLPGQSENLGAQITRQITTADTSGQPARWQVMTAQQAQQELASAKVNGVLEIPADFTPSIAALSSTAAHPVRLTMTVLTNPRRGQSRLLSGLLDRPAGCPPVIPGLGRQLGAAPAAAGAPSATRLLLADPVTVTTQVGHPIGAHSDLGLTAF